MKKETKERMKRAGVSVPSLTRVEKKKRGAEALLTNGPEWPAEKPHTKPLPAAEVVERTIADNAIYKARRSALLREINITEKKEFIDYIKAITEDGLDLILFAWGVLKTESVFYGGVEIDIKAKIWAAEYLTDRAFGKAQQNIKIDSTLHNATDAELLKEVRLLQEKLGEKVMNVNFKTEAIPERTLNGTNGNAGYNENESHSPPSLSGSIEGNGMAGKDSQDKRVQTIPISE